MREIGRCPRKPSSPSRLGSYKARSGATESRYANKRFVRQQVFDSVSRDRYYRHCWVSAERVENELKSNHAPTDETKTEMVFPGVPGCWLPVVVPRLDFRPT